MTFSTYKRHAKNRISRKSSMEMSHQTVLSPQYIPVNEKAAEFHDRPEKIRVLRGGNGSGKTWTGAFETWKEIQRRPGEQGWAITNTYKGIGQYLFPTYKKVIPANEYRIVWANKSKSIPYSLIFPKYGNFELYFLSYEQGRENLQGSRLAWIHFDEEPRRDIIEEGFARTLGKQGRMIFTYSPLMGRSYLNTEIYDKAAISDNIWAATMSLLDNVHVSEEEKQAFMETLSERSRQARVYGFPTDMEGLVYPEFNPDVHVCKPFPIPDDWRFYRALDFGFNHPTVSLIAATDGETLYIISEYYQAQRRIEDHAKEIDRQHHNIQLRTGTQAPPHLISIADHDRQEREEYDALGIYSAPAQKDVIKGIERVESLMAIRSDGSTRYKIFDICPHTIQEHSLYAYPGEDMKGRLKADEKADHPIKEHDDCMDCVRYIAMEEFGAMTWEIPSKNLFASPAEILMR